MSNSVITPEKAAFELTILLNAVFGKDRFPIDVPAVALEISRNRFPDDPILDVKGDNLPKFDGALFRARSKKGWGIIYNNAISSPGRINFTLAHELGHYLLHRLRYPDGIYCGQQDVVRWDSHYGRIEQEANAFAANLLMPLDDFRALIPPKATIDIDALSASADRYRVSFIAAALRWINYTDRRAVLVVSRDGFILWSRASASALKTGAYFKTSAGPIEIPEQALPARACDFEKGRAAVDHERGVWFPREPVRELALLSEQYDFAISLLLLPDEPPAYEWTADPYPDAYEKMLGLSRDGTG